MTSARGMETAAPLAADGRLGASRWRPVHTHIAPARPWPLPDFEELGAHRGLLRFLVWRDIKVRYAQTVLGAAWAVIQPVLTMVVFTLVFGRFARVPSEGAPYAAFSLAALVPWTYFSTALTGASNSLVGSTQLITKIYFPRLLIPAAPIVAGLVDLAIAFAVLIAVLLVYGITPSPLALLVVPLLIAIMMATAGGVGCWLAAVHLRYRDVRYVTAFLVQIWMYLSPVVYPSSLVPARYRWALALNPLVPVIDGWRAVMLGRNDVPWLALGRAGLIAAALLVAGSLYFRRSERLFADVA
jgi:lipopolysaccharide transport system permease protein